ncbi:MAG: response regulator transcription factor [Chromatiales bacterium]|nr:response regulator transcription factor [Chromatiales bacterium]MDH3931281.1 response regulator transcription factor [Chromatiales bacterium]MDH3946425.1 response regulator transcription factor [Chromatiales bacterium]
MRLLMIDDEAATMEGATAWLQKRADTLGQTLDMHYAYSCEEALALPPGPDFDLVLLDYHLSSSADDGTQLTGIEALRAIKAAFPKSPVAIRSGESERRIILSTIQEGAAGFIPKSFREEKTVSAVECVLQTGGVYLPSEALDGANPYPARLAPPDERQREEVLQTLTPQQMKVLHFATQGLGNKQIAHKVHLSEQTVKAHLSEAYRVLGVHNRVEAVIEAVRMQMFLDYEPGKR